MPGHALCHAVTIRSDAAKVRDALTTAHGLRGWTMAEVSGAQASGEVGGRWSFDYANGPKFVWQIVAHDSSKISWTCVEGPGDSVGTGVTFDLGTTADGRVRVDFVHDGWPHQEGNFAKCNALWGMMLHQLRAFAEQGRVAPAYS